MKRDLGAWNWDAVTMNSTRFLEFRLDPANQCEGPPADSGEEVRVALTPKAFDVLRYLVERAGQLVNHNELLNDLWPRAYVQPEVLKHQVLELRKVLGDDARHPRYIETLPRRGYRFIASIRGEAGEASMAEVGPAKILLVGREEAFTELHDCLARASRGQRQIAFVTG